MKHLVILVLSVLTLTAFAQTEGISYESRRLERKIALELGKVEGNLPQINILAKKGEKAQAKAMAEEALKQIEAIEADQKRLAMLDESADEEVLMTAETQETKRYLVNRINQLRYTGVYIDYKADLFGNDYDALLGDLQGALSENGVAFVDSASVADYTITITAKAREYNKVEYNGVASYFAYVDVKSVVQKMASGKRIYENTFTHKGGSVRGFDEAGKDAYKQISPKISEALKAEIAK